MVTPRPSGGRVSGAWSSAVEALFRLPGDAADPAGGCVPDGDVFSCGYTTANGGFFARVAGSRSTGYRVVAIAVPQD